MDRYSDPQAGARLGFVEIPDVYRTWEGGTAKALAEVASEIEGTKGTREEATERHVRYYVSSGLVDPPGKKLGREAHFGIRQLAQVVVARKLLLSEGLTQKQVREAFKTIDWDQAERSDPTLPRTKTEAEQLVAKFRGGAGAVQQLLATKLSRHSAQSVGRLNPRTLVSLRLRPWCEVLAEIADLETLTDGEAAELGRELADALTQLRDQNQMGGTT